LKIEVGNQNYTLNTQAVDPANNYQFQVVITNNASGTFTYS